MYNPALFVFLDYCIPFSCMRQGCSPLTLTPGVLVVPIHTVFFLVLLVIVTLKYMDSD